MADKFKLNPVTGQLDLAPGQDVATTASPTFRNITATNAAVSGTPGTASQVNTGDPNTTGLIVKGNTYTPASKTPNQVTGLLAWWKADALSLNDGNAVTSWADSSGNGNTLSKVTNSPVYKTNILNGKPVVRFANNNDYLKTATLTLAQPYVYFVVTTHTSTTHANTLVSNLTTGGAVIAITATTNLTRMNAGTGVSEATSSGSAWRIITAYFNGASSVGRVNSTQVIASNVGTGGYSNQSIMVSGGNPSGLEGDIAEIAIFNTTVSANDMLALESGWSTKYNISISGSTPQASNLQEWQSSAGALLSGVDSIGRQVLATVAGTPTGTPATGTTVYDTTNNKLYVYNGGWKSVTLA